MSIEDLRAALAEGDLERTQEALATLDASDGQAAFAAAWEHRDEAAASFEVFRWITELPEPLDPADRERWLRAMNNACFVALGHPDDELRLQVARRAVSFGARNIAIFHNAACVFCAVGALDEALDAVAAAVDHGYGSAVMVDDPDLDAIRHTEEFAAALGGARAADEAALRRTLAALRTELFDGGEVPEDLSRLWRRKLALAAVRAASEGGLLLHDTHPDPPEVEGADAALLALVAATDWVGRMRAPHRWVGYFRGEHRAIPTSEAPVVSLGPDGSLRVTADLFDQLRLGVRDPEEARALRRLLTVLRLEDSEPDARGVAARSEPAQATVDAFLARHRTGA